MRTSQLNLNRQQFLEQRISDSDRCRTDLIFDQNVLVTGQRLLKCLAHSVQLPHFIGGKLGKQDGRHSHLDDLHMPIGT